MKALFCCFCLLFQTKSFHESMTHCIGCQGKFPAVLSPAGLADTPLLSLAEYETLLYCSVCYMRALGAEVGIFDCSLWYMSALGGWIFPPVFWSCDVFTSKMTKLAFMLCSVSCLWVVRSSFSGSNKLPPAWQGISRKPHCSPAANTALPCRSPFSLLQP